ncbi:unnamed protein product [Phyllotreta striolata]|uniref:Methyltransferase type 12 domain-containing protein n=1 Tax=Phyllotreta striolata TaxID=444603 RepID=A0A9N9TF99_PHYSR|nr:unnamed protein product [Phyllotreta striolata]
MIEPELWGQNNDLTTFVNVDYMRKYKDWFDWKEGSSIFEFGMGDGRNVREALFPFMPENIKEYVGSDVSPEMVDHAKKTLSSPKASFIVLDICSEAIPEDLVNRFDVVFGFFVMHWVQNTRQALQNMYKMLKPKGQLFLTYVDYVSTDEFYCSSSKHPKWRVYNHERIISPYFNHPCAQDVYKKELSLAGFQIVTYERTKKVYEFPNKESFIGFCLSVNPILREVSTEDFEEYKQYYLKSMENNKLNFTKTCPKTGQVTYNSSYDLNMVLASKH